MTEFEVQMGHPDNTIREVYRGRDLDCTVAGLSPGRPYIFQVRAHNKTGVGVNFLYFIYSFTFTAHFLMIHDGFARLMYACIMGSLLDYVKTFYFSFKLFYTL